MIQLYNKGTTSFTKRGIELHAQKASVTYQDNGRFDLDVEMPVPDGITIDYGMVIRCTVPRQEIEAITLGTVEYWTVNSGETNVPLYSELPKWVPVGYSEWYYSEVSWHDYAVGDKVTYNGANYQCVAWDSSSPMCAIPPANNSSFWSSISGGYQDAGKTVATLNGGDTVFKTGDFNSTYMKASDSAGHEGFIEIAKCTDQSETETRVIPSQTITEQSFVITEVEKSSDGKKVSIHAEHISYQLGRCILGECNLVRVNPATAVMMIRGAMQEEYDGEIYTNLTDETVTADWSWKNAQNAILDPKAGLLQYTAGRMLRNDLDVFLIDKGTATPKYRVSYGTNLLAVDWTGSVSDMVTRIYPTAQTPDGQTLLLPEKYIDSVRSVPFIRPEVLKTGLKVGDTETQSDGTEVELTEDVVFTRMREAASNRYNIDECDKAEIKLEVDWVHLPDTEEYKQYAALKNAAPGEWVEVVNAPLGVVETIQLTGYTFDPILERYEKCTFGKNKTNPTVASYDLQTGSITWRAIASGAITGENIQANSITANEIQANSITAEKIAAKTITTELLSANCVTADEINAGSVTAEKIAAYAITAEKIAAGAIQAGAIAAAAIQAQHIAADAITTDKIAAGAVEASKIAALAITTDKLAAGAVTAEKIGAGSISAGKIDTTDLAAINATLGTASIADARIALADIDFAKVKDLNASSAYFGQAIFQEAIGGKLYVPRLSVGYAQMLGATISDLVIQASNDNFYKLDVDLAGNVTAIQITPSAAEIEQGHTNDGRTIYMGTDILATDLSTENIYASHGLLDQITANQINVDQLWARDAFVGHLMVTDISSNTYIQSTIGDWQSGSTITQTISGINSRISSLGYGTFFYSATEPAAAGVVVGDVWVQPIEDNTWNDIAQYTWDELGGMTWEQVAGQYRMYVWTGNDWKLLFDNMIISELQTQINQNAYAITLKANQSAVDTLSGEVTDFAATLDVQAQAIAAAVSTVNAKTANYVQLTDPVLDPTITLSPGDTWTKAIGDGTWNGLADYEWDDLADLTWDELAGVTIYTWYGNGWIQTGDYGAILNNRSMIEQTDKQIELLVESQLSLGNDIFTNRASIQIQADRITQEVERATRAEDGKIAKTTQYQTADAIVSEAISQSASSAAGLYLAKTGIYQTADAIVTEAVRQAANAGDGAYIKKTTVLQTADAIVSEAVRQSGIAGDESYIEKTSVYQSASDIVATAESYTDGRLSNYSTVSQTSNAISAYVTSNVPGMISNAAYTRISGITITSSGIDISGSQYVNIASGGTFKVTTGDFKIDTSVEASGYVILSGSTNASDATFRVKKNGSVTIKKLLVLNKNNEEVEINLMGAQLWKLNGCATIASYTTDSGGYVSSMLFCDGPRVNFKSAASVTLSGSWSGNTFEVTNSGNSRTSQSTISFSKDASTIKSDLSSDTHKTTLKVDDTDRQTSPLSIEIDGTGAYDAGYDAGVSDGEAAVDFDTESAWSGGYKSVKLTNGKIRYINMPDAATWSAYWPASNVVSVTCNVGGRSFTASFTRPS